MYRGGGDGGGRVEEADVQPEEQGAEEGNVL